MKAKVLVEKLNEFMKIHGEDILVYVYDHEYERDYELDYVRFSEAEKASYGWPPLRPDRLTVRG